MATKKYSKKVYELAILILAGFDSIKHFCEYHDLDYSSVIKIVSGKPTFCGEAFIDNFHQLIQGELDYAVTFIENIPEGIKETDARLCL